MMMRVRNLILACIILSANFTITQATDYYFSNSGNDGNTGTSAESPWQTVTKMQSAINSLQAGDKILFERGSIWYEVKLTVNYKNGSASNPIVFGAYGQGNRPILSGGKRITEFSESNNIYSASVDLQFPHGAISVPTGVLIDNHWPDVARSGEFFTTGSNSSSTLLDEKQSWSANELTGSYLIIQPVHWSWSASPITGNTSNQLNMHPMQYSVAKKKWVGYYIANNDNYLNSNGEWTFKNNTLKVYHTSDLNSKHVQFAVVDSIIGGVNSSNLVFQGITFQMANYRLISFVGGKNIKIDDSDFGYTAGTAVKFHKTENAEIVNNYIHDCGAMGVFTLECNNPVVRYNLFKFIATKNIGLCNYTFRMSAAVSNATPSGANSYVEYNYFDSVGLAIQSHTFLPGRTCSYSYNYIQDYGVTISDCAAIYVASDWDRTVKTVKNNIIRDAITSGPRYYPYGNDAINPHASLHPHALYVDEAGFAYHCDSNTIVNTSFAFYTNRSHSSRFNHCNVVNADLYNSSIYNAVYMKDQVIGPTTFSADRDEVKNNNIVMKNTNSTVYLRHTSSYVSSAPDENNFYFDNNKVVNPYKSDFTIGRYVYDWGSTINEYTLAQMRNNSDKVSVNATDNGSSLNPQGIMFSEVAGKVSEEDFVKTFSNFSKSTKTFSLGNATFKDINGNTVSGNVSVSPFYSKILFYVSGDINTIDEENYVDENLVPALQYVQSNEVEVVQNHSPVIQDANFDVLESDAVPSVLGQLIASDPDAGQSLSYSIVAGNEAGYFSISNAGLLSIASAINLDKNSSFNLTIRVTDNGSPLKSDEATVHVNYIDESVAIVNHAPSIKQQSFNATYDLDLPAAIGKIEASDPDSDQKLSYRIKSGNLDGYFAIDEEYGDLSIISFPLNQVPATFNLVVEVKDDGQDELASEATVTVFLLTSEKVYYIDPGKSVSADEDGSYEKPYHSWSQVKWEDDASYLQKRGTIASAEKLLIMGNNITLGDYGSGSKPVLNSIASDYAVKALDKKNITIKNLKIKAESAIGCVYFIGSDCENNAVENCELEGADYGLRIIDGTSYTVKYNVFTNKVDGIYSIAEFAEIFYNVFKNNHKAINVSSYSSSAKIYNNVFYNNRQGISSSYAEITLFNNIFYLTESGDQALYHKLDKVVSNNNIFYPEQSGFVEISDVQYHDLDAIQKEKGLDLNSFSKDPQFVDVYNNNFAVAEHSYAIDAGKMVGLTQDFYGKAVPYGGGPDIGLVESTTTNQITSVDFYADSDEESVISVYPNPSTGIFTLVIDNTDDTPSEVRIHTLSGDYIFNEAYEAMGSLFTQIDISNYPTGVYVLSVKSRGEFYTEKLIIE